MSAEEQSVIKFTDINDTKSITTTNKQKTIDDFTFSIQFLILLDYF